MLKDVSNIGVVMPLASQQGGAEALLQHLLRQGLTRLQLFCVFLQHGPMAEEARSLGYEVEIIPTTHLSSPINYLQTVLRLRRWIIEKRLDGILSWMPKAQLYASPAALGLSVRVIWYQHGIPTKGALDRLATHLPTDTVLCCSATSQRFQNDISPRRRTFVCYPGVTLPSGSVPSSREARARLKLSDSLPLIGMVARLENWKGVHILLEAAESIFSRYPEACFFVVGGVHPMDRGYKLFLDQKIRALSRPTQFNLVGQKSAEETALWQTAATVIAHPVTGIEAFGMAVPEAMGLGKTVIASNEGGPAEVIENNVNGLLVGKGDPLELAGAILSLLDHPEHRVRLENAAIARAGKFSVPCFVERIEGLLVQSLLLKK